jgi:hypothetical protein
VWVCAVCSAPGYQDTCTPVVACSHHITFGWPSCTSPVRWRGIYLGSVSGKFLLRYDYIVIVTNLHLRHDCCLCCPDLQVPLQPGGPLQVQSSLCLSTSPAPPQQAGAKLPPLGAPLLLHPLLFLQLQLYRCHHQGCQQQRPGYQQAPQALNKLPPAVMCQWQEHYKGQLGSHHFLSQ